MVNLGIGSTCSHPAESKITLQKLVSSDKTKIWTFSLICQAKNALLGFFESQEKGISMPLISSLLPSKLILSLSNVQISQKIYERTTFKTMDVMCNMWHNFLHISIFPYNIGVCHLAHLIYASIRSNPIAHSFPPPTPNNCTACRH